MKQLMTLLSCMLFFTMHSTAQSIGPSSLNASGGSKVIGSNTFEYAIGSVVAGTSYISSGLVVTQGTLQPLTSGTGISTPGIAASDLSVFPNPAAHNLFIQPRFGKGGTLEYALLDVLGRTVLQKTVVLKQGDERQEIIMSSFATGQYTLNVQWQQQGSTYISAYKIQKLN